MMTAAEELIQTAQRSDKPISSVLRALQGGQINKEAILEHFKSQARPVVMAKVKQFQLGNLFHAQRQSFDEWIECRDMTRDLDTWLMFKADCDMAQVDPGAVHRFVTFRLYLPEPSKRRLAVEKQGQVLEAMRQEWIASNKREGWNQWRVS